MHGKTRRQNREQLTSPNYMQVEKGGTRTKRSGAMTWTSVLINKVYLYLLRSVQRVIMPRGVWNKPRPLSKKAIRRQTKRSITHRALWDAKTDEQKEQILQRLALCRQKMKESRDCKRKEGDIEVIDLTADV